MSYWTTDDFGPEDAEKLEAAAKQALYASEEWSAEDEVPVSFCTTENASYQVAILVSPRWIEKYAPYRLGDEMFMLGLRDGRHVYIFGTDMQPPGAGKS